ncbi:MAG: CPBP family intramembrane metalloprotease [Proteobacteria bacterium]|nr:CPBP family intramembrane metalloprotease [Pseudomonadota bacterium]
MRYKTSAMPFQIANQKQIVFALLLSGFLGCFLAYGFVPVSYRLFSGILGPMSQLGFPFLALLFYFSLPDLPCPVFSPPSTKRLLTLCVLPVLISAAFGATKNVPLEFSSSSRLLWNQVAWAWILGPWGEELLFRGWLNSLLNRLNKNTFLSTAPLYPLSVWGTAIAFSLWHIQNYEPGQLPFLIFQLAYTFFVGIWLGFLKWQTGKLWPCVLAHLILNLAADWKLWFML